VNNTTTATVLTRDVCRDAELFLSSLDSDWAEHIRKTGHCRHETRPEREPYEALIRAIAYQQLHAKAGDAILGRMLSLFPSQRFPTSEQLLACDPECLRQCGFSAAKLTSILGIAHAQQEGIVPDLSTALAMPDDELINRLTSLRGVGRWTVEMFLIYSLERADILPVDDLGVRDGFRRLKKLENSPTPRQMRDIGLAWRPFRTVAAWYLWRLPKSE
jgi:DNA-3-methyladenine glycosylase II